VEVPLLIIVVALLARLARTLGMMDARTRRTGAGVLDGLFAFSGQYSNSGELGWPPGVQEEDRDRIWRWTAPEAAAGDLIAGEGDFIDAEGDFSAAQGALIDADVAPVPVRRVR
jgi:hypothetical protein